MTGGNGIEGLAVLLALLFLTNPFCFASLFTSNNSTQASSCKLENQSLSECNDPCTSFALPLGLVSCFTGKCRSLQSSQFVVDRKELVEEI